MPSESTRIHLPDSLRKLSDCCYEARVPNWTLQMRNRLVDLFGLSGVMNPCPARIKAECPARHAEKTPSEDE
jgi:hypothetical protein